MLFINLPSMYLVWRSLRAAQLQRWTAYQLQDGSEL